VSTLVAFYDEPATAGQAVTDIVAAGITPGAIEMMDRLAIRAAEGATGVGYREDAGAALLVELDGAEPECAARMEEVEAICERNGAMEIRVARDDAERELLWRARKAAFAAMGRISTTYYVQDGVIPRTRLPEVLRQIDELARRFDLPVANVFHAGDGNLHPLVCYDGPSDAARAEELAGLILEACLAEGGSITGEHGVGVDKRAQMPKMFGPEDLEAFHRLRCAWDPQGLANPGKVMPTPRLCGEVPGPYRAHPLERAGVAERF
jgi:glycolate dehydrogenase FAD-linked subunit